MSDRRGVMLLMFDLPTKESEQRRIYARFRKAMIRRGYVFFQKSVYIKLLRNISSVESERSWARQAAPSEGRIHMMDMNLNEFRSLTAIRGEPYDVAFFADDVVFVGRNDEKELSDDVLLRMESQMKKRINQCADRKNDSGKMCTEYEKPEWIETYELPF